jgi:hypothetical protein
VGFEPKMDFPTGRNMSLIMLLLKPLWQECLWQEAVQHFLVENIAFNSVGQITSLKYFGRSST